MIGEIISEVYGDDQIIIRNLLDIAVVVGSLFKSFDQFTQNIILRMVSNGGSIQKKEIVSIMDRVKAKREGIQKFDRAMANLQKLRIVTRSGFQNPHYTLDHNFQTKLNEYIETPFRIVGQEYTQTKDTTEFFNLLGLLDQYNQILKQCKIGKVSGGRLTRQNFDFIRLPLGYKISILIKGYLLYKKRSRNNKTIRDVLCLSLAQPGKKYRSMNERQQQIIKQLEMIRLVKRVNQNYFIISQFLYNFAFQQKNRDTKLLDCSVIVETNFKVYVQVPRKLNQKNQNYNLIHNIMKLLVDLEHQEYNFQELIVGQITQNKMKEVFDCKIGVQEYLSFFRAYMFGDLNIQKELGKWNKIHFLGLEGPAEELMIPNNVKQELKLWESYHRNKVSMEIGFNYAEEPLEEYDYYNKP